MNKKIRLIVGVACGVFAAIVFAFFATIHKNTVESICIRTAMAEQVLYDREGIPCEDDLAGTVLPIAIGPNVLFLDLSNTCAVYDSSCMYTGIPMTISTVTDPAYQFYINGERVRNGSNILLDHLGKDIRLQLVITKGTESRQYQIKTMPDDFPAIYMTGKSTQPGEYYGDFLRGNGEHSFIYRMTNEGEITYLQSSDHGDIYNFEKWDIAGESYYSYFQEKIEYDNISRIMLSYAQGVFVVMNENFEIIDEVAVVPDEEKQVVKGYAEAHDFIMLDEGHYITLSYLPRAPIPAHYQGDLTAKTKVLATYLQEVKDGEVLWSWISTDYPDFYLYSVEENDYTNSSLMVADYMHTNSVDIDPRDNNIIISSRHQDSVCKIDRVTGELIWTLGGVGDQFDLDDEQKFSHQHDAQILDNGSLLLFDNNNSSALSRIIQMELDEERHILNHYSEYTMGTFSVACGCVTKLEETIFGIGWGVANNTNCIYSEVDISSNTVLMQLVVDQNMFMTYRVRKF